MKIFNTVNSVRNFSLSSREAGRTVAVVPTMGCLHEGHMQLVDAAKRAADMVIVTIFVNPAQFGPNEDFKKYPRTFKQDCELCKNRGVDAVFAPPLSEMYGTDSSTWVEETELCKELCGKSRPGHFKGVTTIVAKLFNTTLPDIAVFGKKDFQQARIIRKMTEDLRFPVKIVLVATVREEDGLAMSSRNRYLSPSERKKALSIRKSLLATKSAINEGAKSGKKIISTIKKTISGSGGRIDYVQIVDSDSLKPAQSISGKLLIAVAAFFGRARLIDNIEINTISKFKSIKRRKK